MDHAWAKDFQPAGPVADRAFGIGAITLEARDGKIDARFHKGEVIASEARPRLQAEHALGERRQRAAQVGQREPFIDGESVDLVEHPAMRRIDLFGPITTAHVDHPYGW